MYIALRKRALKRCFYYLLSFLCDWVVGEEDLIEVFSKPAEIQSAPFD
jgi:hypothetical protein